MGPTVDLSVVGLLAGVQFLSRHGYGDDQLRKPRCMLWFCGLLTLALNTADSVAHRQFGTVLVDAVGPALLIGFVSAVPMSLDSPLDLVSRWPVMFSGIARER